MFKRILFLIMVFAAGYISAQNYPLVTIQDIQYVPDSLQTSDPPSPLQGDTVRIQGLVMVRPVIHPVTDRGVIISAGARWSIYVQDPNGGLWGGINVLQMDTVGAAQATNFALIDTAQIVEFTGVVNEYYTTTQLEILTNPPVQVQVVGAQSKRPEPIELTLEDLFTSENTYNFNAEKYESMYVIFRNVISSDRASNGNFKINDGNGHFAFVYNQSRYFKTPSSGGIGNYQPPQDGSFLGYLRGVVTTRADGYYIVPMYPGDVGPTLASPPLISTIKREPVLVGPNQSVEVSANIRDLDGYVASAKLSYSVNGGARNELVMTKLPSDTTIFTVTIPGVPDSALVDFFIKSMDNQGNLSVNPQDTVKGNYFYLVLNRPLTIADVQYSPMGSGYSAYHRYRVAISGVVTASANDLPGWGTTPLRVYMQDGEGAWKGIQIGTLGNMGAEVVNLQRGDNVTINGLINEVFDVTRIDSVTSVIVNPSVNPVPDPSVLTTGTMGTTGGTLVEREKWESVLTQYQNITVDSANADGASNFGEIFVNDGSGKTRVELQDGDHYYHNAWEDSLDGIELVKGDKFSSMTGVMYYSFSNYKLVPRKNDDFVGYVPVGVNDAGNVPYGYKLNQNYPNPFNPATTISYSVARDGFVKLRIFNILGQEVMSLVNQHQNAGSYKVIFDASRLSSGVYLYNLETDGFTSVKKMILLK